MLQPMQYSETPAPSELRHVVKARWTLGVPGLPGDWFSHVATPDGCMELIYRLAGRSAWESEQPARFVAGITTRPAELRLSGGSRFVGLRIWPWAWNAIARCPSPALIDRWADLSVAAPGLPVSADEWLRPFQPGILDSATVSLAKAILASRTVREVAERSGRSQRSVQRWFDRQVGVPPRTYLRLLRFSGAYAELPQAAASLAGHAADHGFADQAHMAREFRSFSGVPAATARSKATGPFR